MKRMRRLSRSVLIVVVVGFLGMSSCCSGCSLFDYDRVAYDPLLKYEMAGFPVQRTNIDNPGLLEWPFIRSNNLYHLEVVYSSEFFYGRGAMRPPVTSITVRDYNNNLISRLSNSMLLEYSLFSNKVYALDTTYNLLILHVESGSISTNALSQPIEWGSVFANNQPQPIFPGLYYPYCILESLSPGGRYVVVRREFPIPNEGLRVGLVIFDTLERRIIPLHVTDRIPREHHGSRFVDLHGYITHDLRRIIVHVEPCFLHPRGDKTTTSGRNPRELEGHWTIDISSLGLTE